jgi:hypothetical protein
MSAKSSKDRASLCAFSFSDGRRCRALRHKPNSRYCLAHARKVRHLEEADEVAQEILEPISGNFVSSASLTQSLVHLFAAVAEGRIPPRRASALAKVSGILMKSIDPSSQEFRTVFIQTYWAQLVRSSYGDLPPFTRPGPPDPDPDPDDTDESDADSLPEFRHRRHSRRGTVFVAAAF